MRLMKSNPRAVPPPHGGRFELVLSTRYAARVWQPTNRQWWTLFIVALLIVAAWPPAGDRSLALKFVNWAVDPFDRLPTLPPPYGPGEGDDLEAVNAHDLQTRMYDELYNKGGWTRVRLELKVAEDPFNTATERQLLVAAGVVAAFLVWKRS
jgi:hypothetical protein